MLLSRPVEPLRRHRSRPLDLHPVPGAHAGLIGAAAVPGAAGGVGEARAELAPEAAAVLDAIARDGDCGIRDANARIDAYNVVRDTLNQAQQ